MKTSPLPAWFGRMFTHAVPTPAELLATAEREGPESQNNLGIIYMASAHRGASDEAAATCFTGAANRGYAPGQYNLALLYERGRGVPRDHQEARKWFLRAAEQGNSAAHFHLGLQCHRRSLDSGNADAPECRIEALKWLLLAAEHAHHNAETVCGSLILEMTYAQVRESSRRAVAFKKSAPPLPQSSPSTA
jgi:TPR repeat protein